MTGTELFPATVLGRKAVVYVRQSTQSQVMTNLESRRRQYDLVELAREQGFARVEIIDCSATIRMRRIASPGDVPERRQRCLTTMLPTPAGPIGSIWVDGVLCSAAVGGAEQHSINP